MREMEMPIGRPRAGRLKSLQQRHEVRLRGLPRAAVVPASAGRTRADLYGSTRSEASAISPRRGDLAPGVREGGLCAVVAAVLTAPQTARGGPKPAPLCVSNRSTLPRA